MDTDVIGIDSEEWEELGKDQERSLLRQVAAELSDLIRDSALSGNLAMTDDVPLAKEYDDGTIVVDLPFIGKTVRLRLELLNG